MNLQTGASNKAVQQKDVEFFRKVSFTGDNINPCIYMKKNTKGIIYIVFYIDNDIMKRNS